MTMQNRYAVVLPGGGKELSDVTEVKIAFLIEPIQPFDRATRIIVSRKREIDGFSVFHRNLRNGKVLDGKPGGIKDGDGVRTSRFFFPIITSPKVPALSAAW